MRCVGNGTADRAYSSQPLRSHTAPTHAHEHTHPGHLHSQGRHTLADSYRHSLRDTKETLTDSGIFKYRDTLIDRDTANRTHSTGARAESHSNTETLKYRNTLTTETHSDMRTRALSQAQGNRGGRGLRFLRGGEGGRVPARAHTTAPLSAANVQKFTTDRRTQTF